MVESNLIWTFQFMYHRDMMNAAVHMAPARFSPLTEALCLDIEAALEAEGKTWKEAGEIEGFLAVRTAMI